MVAHWGNVRISYIRATENKTETTIWGLGSLFLLVWAGSNQQAALPSACLSRAWVA